MRFVSYTIIVSPHQLPLAQELIAQLGVGNYRYVYQDEDVGKERVAIGWSGDETAAWCVLDSSAEGREWLENADFLMSGVRDLDLMERRAAKGLRTSYSAERWFTPRAGFLRLLNPSYFRMARRFVRLVKAGSVTCLPLGVWAARDMARLVGLFSGDWRCVFRAPRLTFASEPMGEIVGYPWMRMCGYFVASAEAKPIPAQEAAEPRARALRVLWVGRLLRWKSVPTLFKAVYAANKTTPTVLTIVGRGVDLPRLKRLDADLARKYAVPSLVTYHAPVPMLEVRSLMRSHDVYVLPSNVCEGWGAVVSEAMEEEMEVFGTYEAGSSATMLPEENLFHAGDWHALSERLVRFGQSRVRHCHGIGNWNAKFAAKQLVERQMRDGGLR